MVRHLPGTALSTIQEPATCGLTVLMLKKLPIAPWGWKDLNIFGWPLVGAILLFMYLGNNYGRVWYLVAGAPVILLIWLVSFFRDPPRRIPDDPGAIVAPADGTVVDI